MVINPSFFVVKYIIFLFNYVKISNFLKTEKLHRFKHLQSFNFLLKQLSAVCAIIENLTRAWFEVGPSKRLKYLNKK